MGIIKISSESIVHLHWYIPIKAACIITPLALSLIFFPLGAGVLQAAQDNQMETLLEGFDDTPSTAPDRSTEEVLSGSEENTGASSRDKPSGARRSAVSIDGYLKGSATWNTAADEPQPGQTDWRGLSKLRSEIQTDVAARPGGRYKLWVSGKMFYDAAYGIRGRDEFTDEVIDEYEWEAEWREVYLQAGVSPQVDLKVGRQIVVWGRSDNLRITDVLNPLDLREPGLTDIEDLRLPAAMSRLDGYWDQWSVTMIAVHEIRFNKNPVFGSDFFPDTMAPPPEEIPSDSLDNTEWAVALNGVFSGKDISLYWADLFDDTAHVTLDPNSRSVLEHARVTMGGAAANLVLDNWILFGEAAYWSGLKFFNTATDTHQRMDGLAGIEYSGFDEMTVTVEWAIQHIVDFDERLKSAPDFAQQDAMVNAVRLTRTFLNETMDITLLAQIYGPLGQDGSIMRLCLEYDWNDAISTKLGAALYGSGDRYALRRIGDNDRIFFEIKYSY
jgi:hypothetical protein